MRKLRRLALPAVVLVSLLAMPVSALAEEVPTEAPAGQAETAAPPTSGWVPQGEASEGSGNAAAPTQHGSSLGSGGGSSHPSSTSKPPAPPSEPPVATEPAPVSAPSGSYEPETSTVEEPAPAAGSGDVVAKPQVADAPAKTAHLDLAAADPVARSEPSAGGSGSELAAASTSAQVAPDSGSLPWPALIVCGLILLIAGTRLLLGPIEPESFRYSRFRFVRRAFPRA